MEEWLSADGFAAALVEQREVKIGSMARGEQEMLVHTAWGVQTGLPRFGADTSCLTDELGVRSCYL